MKMTKNEYKQFMSECTNRFYTDKNYTKKKFDEDLDSVEVLPVDLSKYPAIKPDTKDWINKLFDEEDTDREGNYMLRGFTRMEGREMELLNLSYGDYGHCLNFWAYNDDERLIYTFCEGDTTLKLFATREEYEAEKLDTLNWYMEAAS